MTKLHNIIKIHIVGISKVNYEGNYFLYKICYYCYFDEAVEMVGWSKKFYVSVVKINSEIII